MDAGLRDCQAPSANASLNATDVATDISRQYQLHQHVFGDVKRVHFPNFPPYLGGFTDVVTVETTNRSTLSPRGH